MKPKSIIEMNLLDPAVRAMVRNGCFLRSYQAEALRTIFDAVMAGKGGRLAVTSRGSRERTRPRPSWRPR